MNFKRITAFLISLMLLFSLCSCAEEEEAEPTAEDIAAQILSEMSLEEKIMQLFLVSCHSEDTAAKAAAASVGGICLYAFSFEGKSPDELISDMARLQSLAELPLIISTDEEGGTVNRVSLNSKLRDAPFLSPSKLYSEGGSELIKSDTAEKAELLLSLGINTNLAPVCDVPLSSSDYIYPRCFSCDAGETADYISLVVKTMSDCKIGSVLKHFPGYGGSEDTHEGTAYDYRSYGEFESRDFLPFIAGINAGADAVMVSHNIVTCMDENNPASLSPEIHRILRRELGFEGVIITDDLCMSAISQSESIEDAAVRAVAAGNDMICCEDFSAAAGAIITAVEDGTISLSDIESSVLRILLWKTELGLIDINSFEE